MREIERLAIVRRQQQQADRLAGILVEQLVHGEEVAQRLAHLLAGDVEEAVVHPVLRHDAVAEGATALRDLVLVVREDQVEAAGMDVESLAQMLRAHRRALDVPARPAATPGTCPARLVRRRGLPQHEVGGVLLVGRDLDPGTGHQLVVRAPRQAAVVVHRGHAEQHMTLGGVGVAPAISRSMMAIICATNFVARGSNRAAALALHVAAIGVGGARGQRLDGLGVVGGPHHDAVVDIGDVTRR